MQEENTKLRSRIEVLQNKFNHLEHYGRRDNIKVSGVPDSISDNELEAFHRIGKSKGNSKKTIDLFRNRKFRKRTLYNKKKLASINGVVGWGNST